MKEEITNIIESKPQAEKSIIKDQYENSILRWASMYDEIQARPDAQVDLSSNRVQQLNQIKDRFEQLKNHINGLNIAENTNSLEQFKSYYRDFEQQYAQVLLEILSLVRAASVDLSDPAEVNKLIKRSQNERSKFEKS